MSDPTAVIFGAGKIGRGFIAHLLRLSGFRITFVEKNPEVVSLLRANPRYTIHVMGAPERDMQITNFEALSTTESDFVAERVASADIVFVAIGGPNLPQIAPLLAAGLRLARSKNRDSLNVILCENYSRPAQWLRELILDRLDEEEKQWVNAKAGLVETLVLRSCVEPAPEIKAADPLAVNVQNAWELPADRAAAAGEIPRIQGLVWRDNFQGALTRKLFTYNSINAVMAYTGYLKGYTLLSEAANAPDILALARAAGRESGEALCKTYGFDPEDQARFAESAIQKYQKHEIVDPIERNARDPLRKLGRHDRLVGPAILAMECGIRPVALSRAIAAALHYDYAQDAAAQNLQEMIRERGLGETMQRVCGIDGESSLAGMITGAYKAWRSAHR